MQRYSQNIGLESVHPDWKSKLGSVFAFLQRNREYNDLVHIYEYRKALVSTTTPKEKAMALLHYAVYTQTQPKLDSLYAFFSEIEAKEKFDTFRDFVQSLDGIKKKKSWTNPECSDISYQGLFHRLKNKEGWGEKTAALFVKAIFKIHNQYSSELGFWQDITVGVKTDDKLFLPVDSVIEYIFNTLFPGQKWDFGTINGLLQEHCSGNDIEVWDDLWFWGFITQKTVNNERVVALNISKLWYLQGVSKEASSLDRVVNLADEFIKYNS